MKRTLIIGLAIAAVAGVSVWYFVFTPAQKTIKWKTVASDTGTIAINVTSTGSLSAVTTVQVGAQVSGIVSKLFVDYNSVVKKGQIVALLDTTLLYAAMRDAAAAVEKAQVQLELANRQFVRTDTLFHEKVAAQSEFDLAYSNLKSAQADLKSRTAALEHEKTNLRYATIKAPIDGTVISRNVDVGQTVISSFNAPTLFTIANDLTQMQVLANVDEADIGQVAVGQEVTFTVDAYPYKGFHGVVALIRLQPVVVQNVNNYTVVINVANPDLKLLPGLTANVIIKIIAHSRALRVPINAIHFTPDDNYLRAHLTSPAIIDVKTKKIGSNEVPQPGTICYLWIKNQDIIQPRQITAGLFDGTYLEVTNGIRKGEEVVMGLTNENAAASAAGNNPFMPKMPPRRTLR
jgi:HlyD family secretion protein